MPTLGEPLIEIKYYSFGDRLFATRTYTDLVTAYNDMIETALPALAYPYGTLSGHTYNFRPLQDGHTFDLFAAVLGV